MTVVMLALWARGLWPTINPAGTSTWRYTRELDGETQQWTITITGRKARETWTSDGQVIADTTTSLTLRDETYWIAHRNGELHRQGWRLATIEPAARTTSPTP